MPVNTIAIPNLFAASITSASLTDPPGPSILVSALVTLLLLVSGAFYFRRLERSFADVL